MSDENLLDRVNSVCDRFEDAWISGQAPDLAEYLVSWHGEEQRELFQHLLSLELEYSAKLSLNRTPHDYLQRFPEFADIVSLVCSTDSDETEETQHSSEFLRHERGNSAISEGSPSPHSLDESAVVVRELIAKARAGDRGALGELLQRHRGYLRLIAQREIGGRLAARLDASDLVQRSCLSALRNIGAFGGASGEEFLAWLLEIHRRNIQDVIRDHTQTKKRAVGSEQKGVDANSLVDESSPSQRLLHGERAVWLANMLERLPQDQREAVRLRHLEGWTLDRLAQRFQREPPAVAALVYRGMENLRKLMAR